MERTLSLRLASLFRLSLELPSHILWPPAATPLRWRKRGSLFSQLEVQSCDEDCLRSEPNFVIPIGL
uniref:Uncharacterized protein n=1 Tax=Manihot esculenta TaxID=3983 RepID=A0A2C9VHP7_MANES